MEIKFSYNQDFETKLNELKIKYGDEIFNLEGIGWQLDLPKYNKSFFKKGSDFLDNDSVDANANVRHNNASTYFNEVYKPFTRLNALYLIWKAINKNFGLKSANNFLEGEISGALYVHDLHSATVVPYCYAYSLEYIIKNGLTFIKTVNSKPAKHLSTFIQHIIQLVMFAANQSSGAVGLPDTFVWMNYFVRKEMEFPKDNDLLNQYFQILIYSLNQPVRTNQAAFTNFTLMDRYYLENLFTGKKYPDGTEIVDHIEDIIDLQKRFLSWIREERSVQMFTFPVLTASLLYKDNEFMDKDFARFITDHNTKWQDINIYASSSVDSLASCCRLQSSTKTIESNNKLTGMVNSIGGTDLDIGSFKVITINIPNIALESKKTGRDFFEILEERVEIVQKSLYVIRETIKERIAQGILPLYTCGLINLSRQYGTIGITGVYEGTETASEEYIKDENYTEKGIEFVDKLMNKINSMIETGFEKYGFTFNVEQIPGEKACATLASKDKIVYNTNYILYSNQWLPLISKNLLTDRIKCSSLFDKKVQGGAILHINLGNQISDKDLYWELVNIVAKSGVVYFAFNSEINVCEEQHSFFGNKCPICGKEKADSFLRIVGYLVPISSWNKVRKNYESPKRQRYELNK
ncbi:MAG: anaerobic ribonucleoside-triphosphate reductase [Methanogenium sp.]|jgi:ribonucleoside-triphosphate reductase